MPTSGDIAASSGYQVDDIMMPSECKYKLALNAERKLAIEGAELDRIDQQRITEQERGAKTNAKKLSAYCIAYEVQKEIVKNATLDRVFLMRSAADLGHVDAMRWMNLHIKSSGFFAGLGKTLYCLPVAENTSSEVVSDIASTAYQYALQLFITVQALREKARSWELEAVQKCIACYDDGPGELGHKTYGLGSCINAGKLSLTVLFANGNAKKAAALWDDLTFSTQQTLPRVIETSSTSADPCQDLRFKSAPLIDFCTASAMTLTGSTVHQNVAVKFNKMLEALDGPRVKANAVAGC
jgi:hypothetical protein